MTLLALQTVWIDIQEIEFLRLVSVLLSMATASLLLASTIGRWKVMPLHLRRVMPWITATYFVIAYGSGEAYAQHAPSGLRVLLLPLVLLGLIFALLYGMRLKNPFVPPPPGAKFLEPVDESDCGVGRADHGFDRRPQD